MRLIVVFSHLAPRRKSLRANDSDVAFAEGGFRRVRMMSISGTRDRLAVRAGSLMVLAGVVMVAAPAAAQQRTADRQVTFTKDVAPILQRSCVRCHRPGTNAPMSLMTYEDARPWARS